MQSNRTVVRQYSDLTYIDNRGRGWNSCYGRNDNNRFISSIAIQISYEFGESQMESFFLCVFLYNLKLNIMMNNVEVL